MKILHPNNWIVEFVSLLAIRSQLASTKVVESSNCSLMNNNCITFMDKIGDFSLIKATTTEATTTEATTTEATTTAIYISGIVAGIMSLVTGLICYWKIKSSHDKHNDLSLNDYQQDSPAPASGITNDIVNTSQNVGSDILGSMPEHSYDGSSINL